MKCTICKQGETAPGRVTVKLERGDAVILVRDVPADVCGDCLEYYLTEDIASRIYAQADDAAKRNAELEIIRFAA